jgi:hypothetical protein
MSSNKYPGPLRSNTLVEVCDAAVAISALFHPSGIAALFAVFVPNVNETVPELGDIVILPRAAEYTTVYVAVLTASIADFTAAAIVALV